MCIEIDITANIVTAIAEDLRENEKIKNLQLETIVFLQNILKTTADKVEKAVIEVDDISDALTQSSFLLAGKEK